MSNKKFAVAIVGAGLSGMQCARILSTHASQQFQVHVFEKARVVSGRISTRRVTIPSSKNQNVTVRFNHGAQYFTVQTDAMRDQVLEPLLQQGIVKEYDSSRIVVVHPSKDQPGKFEIVKQRVNHHGSLTERRVEQGEEVVHRYVGVPGNRSIVEALASQLPKESCTVHLNSTVQRIALNNVDEDRKKKWAIQLKSNTGDSSLIYPDLFDIVVVSAPLDQTIQLFNASRTSNEDSFRYLMDQMSGDNEARMKPCWAFMISFRTPVSHAAKLEFDSSFVNGHQSIGWIMKCMNLGSDDHSSDQSIHSWVVHSTAEWATDNLELSVEEAKKKLHQDFVKLMEDVVSKEYATWASQSVLYSDAHRWRFASGHLTMNEKPYLYDSDNNIGCCGDWLGKGRVEGAFVSGDEMAKAILKSSTH